MISSEPTNSRPLWNHSGDVPDILRANQGTNEDDSQSDPHPEASVSQSGTTRNSGPDEAYGIVTGVQKEILQRSKMVTGVHEEATYCSPGTSSCKQKKNGPASQPHFCSENTTAMIEADQILLALQQLATIAILQTLIATFTEFPDEAFDMVTGFQQEIFFRCDNNY